MPEPWSGNFYGGGFLEVFINGKDAITYTLADMRILESGERGSFRRPGRTPMARSRCG